MWSYVGIKEEKQFKESDASPWWPQHVCLWAGASEISVLFVASFTALLATQVERCRTDELMLEVWTFLREEALFSLFLPKDVAPCQWCNSARDFTLMIDFPNRKKDSSFRKPTFLLFWQCYLSGFYIDILSVSDNPPLQTLSEHL